MAQGALHLHTKSKKYGKLTEGQLLSVPPTLIKRQKQHFHTLHCGGGRAVRVILGTNGQVWIAPHRGEGEGESPCTAAEREALCLVRNAIQALAAVFVLITAASIEATVQSGAALGACTQHRRTLPSFDLAAGAVTAGFDARKMLQGGSERLMALTAVARGEVLPSQEEE